MTTSDSEFPDTRASLLLQLQAGDDHEAWQDFVTIYRPIIYRLARKRGLQDADAQDLAQQVLFSIVQSIERWQRTDESTRFRHWLRRVAKNAICNALTRRPRDRAAGGTAIQDLLNDQSEDDEFVRELELEHRRELFMRAASIVKSDVATNTWRVFKMAVVDGIPIKDVGERMSMSMGAAYAARGRVMNRLRKVVDELEHHDS